MLQFTFSRRWSAFILLSKFTRYKARSGTSRPIFNKLLASWMTSYTLGSRLMKYFPVFGWRTSRVTFKTAVKWDREKAYEINIIIILWCNQKTGNICIPGNHHIEGDIFIFVRGPNKVAGEFIYQTILFATMVMFNTNIAHADIIYMTNMEMRNRAHLSQGWRTHRDPPLTLHSSRLCGGESQIAPLKMQSDCTF